MVQRAALRAFLDGLQGRLYLGPTCHFFLFFFQPLFLPDFFFFFVTIHFLFSVAFTSLSLPHVAHNPHPPNFGEMFAISLPTHLHPPDACCALASPTKTISSPSTLSFFVPSRHWNWCFDGSGRVFRAVFACAGPPQSPLHTCTTTLLTLLSFFVCVQSSGRYSSTPPFWVDAAKARNKVRNQVFLPCLHCPPLAPIHPHCLPPLPLICARFYLVVSALSAL